MITSFAFRLTKISLLATATILIIMLVYWIIPTYVPDDKQYIATQFSLASASILTLILNVITYAFDEWDTTTEQVVSGAVGIPGMFAGGK